MYTKPHWILFLTVPFNSNQSFAPICCLIHTYLLTVYSPSRHRPSSETALSYVCQKFSPKDLASDPFFILDSDHGTRCYSQSYKRALKIDFLGNASYSSWMDPFFRKSCVPTHPLSLPLPVLGSEYYLGKFHHCVILSKSGRQNLFAMESPYVVAGAYKLLGKMFKCYSCKNVISNPIISSLTSR